MCVEEDSCQKSGQGMMGCRVGFSLPETITALSVVLVLGALSVGAFSKVTNQLDKTREVTAGRSLINGFQLYATDNGGQLLPGIDGRISKTGVNFQGRTISSRAAERYPFRLAPYLDYVLDGTVLVNGNEKQVEEIGMWDYGVSLIPAFGMNFDMVGGHLKSDGSLYGISKIEAMTYRDQADVSILVFASAGTDMLLKSGTSNGYFKIMPPNHPDGNWSGAKWEGKSSPDSYGNVYPRHEGQAVCVFLDGSVQMLGIDDLRDMRLWSRNAAVLNDPNYMPPNY